MKLSCLYCSSEEAFPRIRFHAGLNVVFARVKNYHLTDKDSHNLGKTYLANVIDFCLLATIKQDHAFRRNSERFGGLVFYLEVICVSGKYVTIRRPVSGRANIRIHVADGPMDLRNLSESGWTHRGLGEEKAQKQLDIELGLTAIDPFPYRKGLGYFLRRQNDYNDIFRISNFGIGKDRDWKPFMALLLGFDSNLVSEKYAIEEAITRLKADVASIEKEIGVTSEQLDEVRGKIQLLKDQIASLTKERDALRFFDQDMDLTKELVGDIEKQIGALNERRYRFMSQQEEISTALRTDLSFELGQLRALFEEAQIYFPEALAKEYEELVEFNRGMTSARRSRLRDHATRIAQELETLNVQLRLLDERRAAAAAALQNAETVVQYRRLDRRISSERETLLDLEVRASRLDMTTEQRSQQRDLEIERTKIIGALNAMVNKPNPHYTEVRRYFAESARDILSVYALLSVRVNNLGNLEFEHTISEDLMATKLTSEADGFSYEKMLCVCFDLALLQAFSSRPFYRFAYHDGVFEALYNERKRRLLIKVRDVIRTAGIQYILTVIDSDLPRDESDDQLYFEEDEVIRELHGDDDSGRLFPGPPF